VTNEWAAKLIGESRQHFFSSGTSHPGGDWTEAVMGMRGMPGVTANMHEQIAQEVLPAEFTRLRTGGRRNRWKVDAIVFQSGRVFPSTGRTWRQATFKQSL
jgi:hypothetical protein